MFQLRWKTALTNETEIFQSFIINQYVNRCNYNFLCFSTLLGKTNGVHTNARHDNTEHALTTNLACIFNTFCLSDEMKDRCIAIIQKQIIMKIIIDDGSLQNFDANLKRLSWNGFGES